MNKPADTIFKMLSFQYKPLEAELLKGLAKTGRHDLIKKYEAFTSAQKIKLLDNMASEYGL